ncbi:MAG: fluoride efflux transporter CrcB [Ignavibacteria bacterium]|nr:fluoride efflux transporter CrcB [Ignavibacteria bacterium]
MKEIILVFLGGGIGSALRYLISKSFTGWINNPFPYSTFLVNIIGCFLIGIFLTLPERFDWFTLEYRLFLATGICGGFTTFSTFSYENFALIKEGDYMYFVSYTILSFAIGLAATFLGMYLVKKI